MHRKRSLQPVLSHIFRRLVRRGAPDNPAAFKALFNRFKAVLESNNRALETITDMGEKLGGDYLFDIVYVREAYGELKENMEYSLAVFDELTQKRYSRLRDVFTRIDSLIMRLVSETPGRSRFPVLSLKDVSWDGASAAGGKMAQLAEVRNRLGMDMPDGFVITTTAFDAFVKSNGIGELIRNLPDAGPGESETRELQEAILHGAVPSDVSAAIGKAVDRMRRRHGKSFLAVRSSAADEDSYHSFAGIFRTVLGVPLEKAGVERAYRKVLASLFSGKATAYQRRTGYDPRNMKMAVGCIAMVDAVSSGVLYSSSPDGDGKTLMISAAWGLGETVVESRTEADLYLVRKGAEPELMKTTIGRKERMIRLHGSGGTVESPVSSDRAEKACLSPEQVKTLALLGQKIERHFGDVRDIEWALDDKGRFKILQARPLRSAGNRDRQGETPGAAPDPRSSAILTDRGIVVQRGTGSGKVFVVTKPSDIPSLPRGTVLVAPHDSSLFAGSMPSVSAIITETGSLTSHMAAICRELKIPTVVNVRNATRILRQGQKVTVTADEGGHSAVYRGITTGLQGESGQDVRQMEALYEFRRKRSILRSISPLRLIDPLMDEFTPERCRTMHDILRFMHEKAVAELVESGRRGKLKKRGGVVPLDLPVPAGMLIVDIGGGLQHDRPAGPAKPEQVTSIPFRALIRGMTHPGAWQSEAVALKARDFLSSMIRMSDLERTTDSTAGYNLAVISREYVNMSIRFGYHFNMIDCYCSGMARNNHVYFRFTGGATDLLKRSRRLELIARILNEYGFAARIKGDLLIARLAGLEQAHMEKVLDQTGRLIAFARQLDARLNHNEDITRFAEKFLNGHYELSGDRR